MASRDETSPKPPPPAAEPNDASGVRAADDERKNLLALSEKHGIPGIDVATVSLALADLDLIPRDIARRYSVLPLLVKADSLFLAMATPADKRVVEEIEFVSGKKVLPF